MSNNTLNHNEGLRSIPENVQDITDRQSVIDGAAALVAAIAVRGE
jgi:hypothetical protein